MCPHEQDAESAPMATLAPTDLLDRVLAGGVVVSSELTVSVADVDLLRVRVGDLLRTFGAAERGGLL